MDSLPLSFQVGHPCAYRDLLPKLLAKKKKTLFWQVVALDQELEFNHAQIENSFLFRARSRALHVADFLLDEEGRVLMSKIDKIIESLKEQTYTFYSDGESDVLIQEHILRILHFLKKDPEALPRINRMSTLPSSSYIQDLLLIATEEKTLTKRTLRKAILSALLTPLRQSLGSCFATAPAILVQNEEPYQLLIDLEELIERNRLTRTIAGKVCTAPISPTLGHQDLSKFHHPLLKVWEYTIATFSDYKIDFFRWNLSAGLGLNHEEEGGIGRLLYEGLSSKLEEFNDTAQKLQEEVQHAYSRVKLSESLLRNADSYNRARQLKAEASAHLATFYSMQDMRDKSIQDATKCAQFYHFLIEKYQIKIQGAFQEVFDPAMFFDRAEIFEDSPAGFRLVYKYGRSDPATWIMIKNREEYTKALAHFFLNSEVLLKAECEWKEGVRLIEELTGRLIRYIETEEFFKNAFLRIKKFHKRARGIISELTTPWSYVAGGAMITLVKAYFGLESELQEERHEVESTTDLLLFLLDQMKALSWPVAKRLLEEPHRGLLMNSPTHAFILRPALERFKQAWLDDGFSYTFVRDEVVQKSALFFQNPLSFEEQEILAKLMVVSHFSELKKLHPSKGEKSIAEFRKEMVQEIKEKREKKESPLQIEAQVDHILRRALPLYSREICREIISKVKPGAADLSLPKRVPFFALLEIIKILYLIESQDAALNDNLDFEIRKKIEEFGYGPPPALIFADTNWSYYFFGFLYNPGTEKMELWRLDRSGLNGYPMNFWDSHLENRALWSLIVEPIDWKKNFPQFLPFRV